MSFLSVDFDFFVWNGLESKDDMMDVVSQETGEVSSIPNVYYFDWGHSESWHPSLQSIVWDSRYEAFLSAGVDPAKICDAHLEKGTVSVDEFVAMLSSRFNLTGSHNFSFADSHAHGYSALRESFYGEPIEVVHFDAHADLGYSTDVINKEKDKGVLDCGSWLYHSIDMGIVSKATIVYPDWRELNEFKDSDGDWSPPSHIKDLESGGVVSFHSWSDWLETPAQAHEIDTVFACRSSAWTPPWLDAQAERLFDSLSGISNACLDCDDNYPSIGGYNACQPRGFNTSKMEPRRKLLEGVA